MGRRYEWGDHPRRLHPDLAALAGFWFGIHVERASRERAEGAAYNAGFAYGLRCEGTASYDVPELGEPETGVEP
jgi:hypothetical protein